MAARSRQAAALRKIREIRIAIVVFAGLFVVWWIVEFLTYAGRTGGLDAFDFVFVVIVAVGGWLVFEAWRVPCPQCGNPFFVNRGLALGFHCSSECPYCGLNLGDRSTGARG